MNGRGFSTWYTGSWAAKTLSVYLNRFDRQVECVINSTKLFVVYMAIAIYVCHSKVVRHKLLQVWCFDNYKLFRFSANIEILGVECVVVSQLIELSKWPSKISIAHIKNYIERGEPQYHFWYVSCFEMPRRGKGSKHQDHTFTQPWSTQDIRQVSFQCFNFYVGFIPWQVLYILRRRVFCLTYPPSCHM